MKVSSADEQVVSDVRETDSVLARIKKFHETDFDSARVWRLSPFGVEVVRDEKLDVGERLDLQIVIEGRRTEFSGIVISASVEGGHTIVGIRFLLDQPTRAEKQDNRKSIRWVCSEEHLPKAIAPSPGRFNEFIHFTVRNISANGFQLTTSISNVFLIPKMNLTLSLSLPMVGDTVVTVAIVRIRIDTLGAQDFLDLGVELLDVSRDTRRKLGQYLIQFSDNATLESLRSHNFLPNDVSMGIKFQTSKSEQDYRHIVELRKKSNVESPTDPRDNSSRLILGFVNDKPVFTARVSFPAALDPLEGDQISGSKEGIARRDELIEVSSIHADCPDLLEPEVYLAGLRYICTSCTNSSRHKVQLITKREKKNYFTRVGWDVLGQDKQNAVLLTNAYDAIKGKNTNPLMWNFVWREAADYLIEAGVIKPLGIERVMLSLYRLLGPLARLVFASSTSKIRRLGVTQNKKSERDQQDSDPL